MLDLLIISVPGTISKMPPAAPALLKGSVQHAGFTCKTIDYNIRLYTEVSTVQELETYFSTGLNPEQLDTAKKLIDHWVDEILLLNPRYLGISVFTYQNRIATEMFCQAIKSRSAIKIVLGGQGLSDGSIEGSVNFAQKMVDNQLADYWIRSEGEISLVELLKGNFAYPGINSNTFQQINNLDSIPIPDYTDYDLSLYARRSLPVTGSRGCVRACTFCDIHEHWKYRYRSGESISAELFALSSQYNVYHFDFSDSLINGNLKEFKKFIKILADYNQNATNKIQWNSQYIVRSSSQVDDQYWTDLANSGASELYIGVETGSDRIRDLMKKQFCNQDLDYTMGMLDTHNIGCTFLIIVGYPTEDEQDFQDTLDMFTRYKSLANRIIRNINIGSTLGILPGTDLYKNAKQYGIELDTHENNWIQLDHEDVTLEVRLNRRQKLLDHVAEQGYIIKQDSTAHILQILHNHLDKFNSRLKIKKMIRIKSLSAGNN